MSLKSCLIGQLRGNMGLTAYFTEMSFSSILKCLVRNGNSMYLNRIHSRLIINRFNVGPVTCCHGNGGHLGSPIWTLREKYLS